MSARTADRLRHAAQVTWATVTGLAIGSPVGIALGTVIAQVLR